MCMADLNLEIAMAMGKGPVHAELLSLEIGIYENVQVLSCVVYNSRYLVSLSCLEKKVAGGNVDSENG